MKNHKRMLELLEKIWEKHPTLRLGQLILNCVKSERDLYYLSDRELTKALKNIYEK